MDLPAVCATGVAAQFVELGLTLLALATFARVVGRGTAVTT